MSSAPEEPTPGVRHMTVHNDASPEFVRMRMWIDVEEEDDPEDGDEEQLPEERSA